MKLILRFLYRLIPLNFRNKIQHRRTQLTNFRILAKDYGQFQTIKKWSCINSSGQPIPWYTYPAIEYLDHLDFSHMNVFEFGSGNSTLWWANKAKKVTSVEDDEKWYDQILLSNHFIHDKVQYLFKKNNEYISSLSDEANIVIIDGTNRQECAEHLLNNYNKENLFVVIFDNSDWYPATIQKLRENLKWIQVDFHGFTPINNYTSTTTIYINPAFQSHLKYIKPLHSIAPIMATNDI